MNEREFWSSETVQSLQDVQKRHPFGSIEHRQAWQQLKAYCATVAGIDTAKRIFSTYE